MMIILKSNFVLPQKSDPLPASFRPPAASRQATLYRRVSLAEQIAGGRRVLEREGVFADWSGDPEAFGRLTEDERAEWIQFAETSFMLRRAFFERHLALLEAAQTVPTPRAAEQVFESRIVLGTLAGILREWQAWRRETGKYPLDRWNYESGPWTGDAGEAE